MKGSTMITKIKVYNRFNMEIVAQFGRDSGFPFRDMAWHLVSIYTGDAQSPLYLTDKTISSLTEIGLRGHLSMGFWDITDDPRVIDELKKSHPKYVLFSQEQANQVVKFMEDRKAETGDEVLVAHCDAGVSRSGAVSEFACEFFGLDRRDFLKENPYLRANPTVLRMLREASGMPMVSAFTEDRKAEAERQKKEFNELLDKYGHVFM